MQNEWKYTIPISRADTDSEGIFLVGEASGPERDTHGTQIDPTAIVDFQRQIVERAAMGNPIPYKDSHSKDKSVLEDLGWVTDASVTPDFHLRVKVRLDDTNPASVFLHGAVARGKQYGMSIKGTVHDFKYEADKSGARALKLFKITLSEISNTTRPSWVPSFGTVLARSIDGESGEFEMSEETNTAPAVDEQMTELADEASTVQNSDSTENPVEETTVDEPVIERALSKADKDELREAFAALEAKMKSLGVIDAPETTAEKPAAPADEVAREEETSDTGDTTESLTAVGGTTISREAMEAFGTYIATEIARAMEPLQKSLAEKDALIDELESMPAGSVPPRIARQKFDGAGDAIASQLARMESPEDRLRFALEKIYNG